jgi:hypothetical protein
MATAISWPVCTTLMLVGFGVVSCSALGSRRRPKFYLRLTGASLAALAFALGLAFALRFSALPQHAFGPLWLGLLIAALAVAPVFCYDTLGPSKDAPDGEGGGGSGPPPPSRPRGDPPLPDADPARVRRRDHNRPKLRGISSRRPAAHPVRRRVPAG